MSLWTNINAGAAAAGSGGVVTVPYPASPVAGSLLALWACSDASGSSFTISDPGFTSLGVITSGATCQIYGKLATGGESGTFTITGSEASFGVCVQYSGAPASLAGIVTASGSTSGTAASGSVPAWPALSILNAKQLVLVGTSVYCNTSCSGNTNLPSPWTVDLGSDSTSFDFMIAQQVIETTAANISAGNWESTNYAGTINYGTIIVALAPGGALTTAVPCSVSS